MPKMKDYLLFFSKALVFGIFSFALFWYFINPYNANFKTGEIAVNTYALNIFVGWTFFSAFLLLRADEEWKKVDETVTHKNFKQFLVEASKKMAPTVKMTYLIISAFVVISFYLFHYESAILAFLIIFSISFLVAMTAMVLFDLDEPIEGLINVPNIPEEWLKKLHAHRKTKIN